MAINPQHLFSLTYKDYSNEPSVVKGNMGAITALTIAAFLAQFGDLKTAQQALTLGTLVHDSWTGDSTVYSGALPTDLNAQRERKWRVEFEDTTNFTKGRYEIPIAKVTGLLLPNTDQADLSAAAWAAWITAFEAMAKSPDGNGVNVLGATLVGRNL